MCWYCCKWEVLDVNHRVGCELLDLNIFATSWNVSGWHEQGEILLQGSIWNPQYFTLFLLHDGHDLSANVGDAASLDNTCNTVGRRVVFLWLTHPIESSFIFPHSVTQLPDQCDFFLFLHNPSTTHFHLYQACNETNVDTNQQDCGNKRLTVVNCEDKLV